MFVCTPLLPAATSSHNGIKVAKTVATRTISVTTGAIMRALDVSSPSGPTKEIIRISIQDKIITVHI